MILSYIKMMISEFLILFMISSKKHESLVVIIEERKPSRIITDKI